MKKTAILVILTISIVVLTSIFGVINNQISYSISPEFFTKSMFPRFGFVEYGLDTPRLTAAIIGIWSTWWLGLIIGLIYSIISLSKNNTKTIFSYLTNAILTTFIFVFASGILGFIFGKISLTNVIINRGFSGSQEQLKNFVTVGYIHDFEYGGAILAILFVTLKPFLKRPSHNSGFKQLRSFF
ncbi:hypothetical protein FNO01nite_34600 [Flavobacterium noncentrifugens]|nr:hypothetical protein [Flavobacterium noncentrifugens]GEP52788.1 hypothetical protein FNO01nite_34600 [Flavobacterium noncentrifugens]